MLSDRRDSHIPVVCSGPLRCARRRAHVSVCRTVVGAPRGGGPLRRTRYRDQELSLCAGPRSATLGMEARCDALVTVMKSCLCVQDRGRRRS